MTGKSFIIVKHIGMCEEGEVVTSKERVEQIVRDQVPPGLSRGILWDAIETAILEEREACAKIAEEIKTPAGEIVVGDHRFESRLRWQRSDIAEAIRKRGQQ